MIETVLVCAVLVCALGWAWRINLALNHPEKEQRLRELGRHWLEEQERLAKKLASGATKAAELGAAIYERMKKK